MKNPNEEYKKALADFFERELLYDKDALEKTLLEYNGIFKDIAAGAIIIYLKNANQDKFLEGK